MSTSVANDQLHDPNIEIPGSSVPSELKEAIRKFLLRGEVALQNHVQMVGGDRYIGLGREVDRVTTWKVAEVLLRLPDQEPPAAKKALGLPEGLEFEDEVASEQVNVDAPETSAEDKVRNITFTYSLEESTGYNSTTRLYAAAASLRLAHQLFGTEVEANQFVLIYDQMGSGGRFKLHRRFFLNFGKVLGEAEWTMPCTLLLISLLCTQNAREVFHEDAFDPDLFKAAATRKRSPERPDERNDRGRYNRRGDSRDRHEEGDSILDTILRRVGEQHREGSPNQKAEPVIKQPVPASEEEYVVRNKLLLGRYMGVRDLLEKCTPMPDLYLALDLFWFLQSVPDTRMKERVMAAMCRVYQRISGQRDHPVIGATPPPEKRKREDSPDRNRLDTRRREERRDDRREEEPRVKRSRPDDSPPRTRPPPSRPVPEAGRREHRVVKRDARETREARDSRDPREAGRPVRDDGRGHYPSFGGAAPRYGEDRKRPEDRRPDDRRRDGSRERDAARRQPSRSRREEEKPRRPSVDKPGRGDPRAAAADPFRADPRSDRADPRAPLDRRHRDDRDDEERGRADYESSRLKKLEAPRDPFDARVREPERERERGGGYGGRDADAPRSRREADWVDPAKGMFDSRDDSLKAYKGTFDAREDPLKARKEEAPVSLKPYPGTSAAAPRERSPYRDEPPRPKAVPLPPDVRASRDPFPVDLPRLPDPRYERPASDLDRSRREDPFLSRREPSPPPRVDWDPRRVPTLESSTRAFLERPPTAFGSIAESSSRWPEDRPLKRVEERRRELDLDPWTRRPREGPPAWPESPRRERSPDARYGAGAGPFAPAPLPAYKSAEVGREAKPAWPDPEPRRAAAPPARAEFRGVVDLEPAAVPRREKASSRLPVEEPAVARRVPDPAPVKPTKKYEDVAAEWFDKKYGPAGTKPAAAAPPRTATKQKTVPSKAPIQVSSDLESMQGSDGTDSGSGSDESASSYTDTASGSGSSTVSSRPKHRGTKRRGRR
eukprot:EG_transcript_1275